MRKVVLASVMIAAGLGLARADDGDYPRSGWMSLSQVTAKLHEMGFSDISKIEADDGLWEAKGHLDGVYTEVKLDPYNGQVVERHRKQVHGYKLEDHDHDHDED